MKQKSLYLTVVLLVGLIFVGITVAQRPVTNVDAARHPNLAEAQHHMVEAYEKLEAAQKGYKDELGGHADKAKQFLEQASREVKEAAEYADQHHK
jgi:F0F1-type ATP synthase membrane subunit b/b'